MTVADLSRTATLESMTQLGDLGLGELEAVGSEPTTAADELTKRKGYNPSFLSGWKIPLPRAIGPAASDMRALRRGGSGVELKYTHFSVIMSASRRLPMITAANINTAGSVCLPRGGEIWSFDGRLDKSDQFGEQLYFKNPLDKGHMVRRLDPVWGPTKVAGLADVDTFHYTNACPQKDEINQGIWNELEDYILYHAMAERMQVNVYTGPFFSDHDLPHDSGALIPLAFWKVVAIVTDDGRPSATAYTISQEGALGNLEFVFAGFKTFQISVQQVVDQAHVDFGPLVPYDGFSHQELASGQPMAQELESLEQVRI